MDIKHSRRSFLQTAGAAGVAAAVGRVGTAAAQGYVLSATEGEHLVHFRDHGNIFIKVGSATGSDNLALGTQQVMVGTGIPIHRHFHMDEAFCVLDGSGTFILNDVRHSFEKGFFRDTCTPPGVPPKQLTREQITEIARKYGTEFR